MDLEQEVFVVYVTTLFHQIEVHPDFQVQIAALIANKTLVIILAEHSDFEDMFCKESTAMLSKHTKVNTYAIDTEEGKQLLYGLIYSLGLVELKTFKTYIKTNLANYFICFLKSPVSATILFDKKPHGSF